MTETLGDLLRGGADAATVPQLDLDGLVAEAGKRQRRRRLALGVTAVAAAGAIAAGSVLVARATPNAQEPPPVAPPSPSQSHSVAVDPQGARPLVYADGSTVHVGDQTVEARDPVAFIDGTDDGAVYEATYDGTLWFTDGTTTSKIGTSGCTACPTAHGGVVTTGDSGSLVVWADASLGKNESPVEFVVYDTSLREEVARIPFTHPGQYDYVVYVDEDQVYVTPEEGTAGCWVLSTPRCKDPHVFRFDVASGGTTKIRLADLDAELSTRARVFVAQDDGVDFNGPGITEDLSFRQIGRRLATVTSAGDPLLVSRTNGDEVRLRLPNGYTAPGLEWNGTVIRMAQWLDDDTIVVWANEGGGDLPPQHGDLLVCRLPDGVCRVEVPRSSSPYVAPY